MNIKNAFKSLTIFEIILWCLSVTIITISFCFVRDNWINLIASILGVSCLIFLAKGEPLGHILSICFSITYTIVSYQFKYYGEMVTCLAMNLPIAIASLIMWLKHPFKEGSSQIKIGHLDYKKILIVTSLTIVVTIAFYFILDAFNTPNIIFSTISIATSFGACSLLLLRVPFASILYCLNDIVLIVLWSLATKSQITYLPVLICFCVFLVNDIYGFINLSLIRKKQSIEMKNTDEQL